MCVAESCIVGKKTMRFVEPRGGLFHEDGRDSCEAKGFGAVTSWMIFWIDVLLQWQQIEEAVEGVVEYNDLLDVVGFFSRAHPVSE